MLRVIAVVNQKGGVAKTTTVVNLAVALAKLGKKTVVVDLDPQANATQALGVQIAEQGSETPSVYEVLLDSLPLAEALSATETKNLQCVRSTVDLAGAEVELVEFEGRESIIAKSLAEFVESDAGKSTDFVVIDCPPSLGLLTLNALVATQELLVPIQAEFYALDGLGQLVTTINLVRQGLNPSLAVDHIVLTMVDTADSGQRHVVDEVYSYFAPEVVLGQVPRDPHTHTAPAAGKTVVGESPESPAAKAYGDIASVLVKKPGRKPTAATESKKQPVKPKKTSKKSTKAATKTASKKG
ncbi:MAG: AAA family ATPase [Candidatus Nanopelagicales bacterium]